VILGWTSPSGEEVLPMEKIIEQFSLYHLSKSAPIHSRKKLEWLNSIHLRQKGKDQILDLFLPYFERAGLPVNRFDRDDLFRIADALKDNIVLLSQVSEYLGIFFDEKFGYEDGARTILQDGEHRRRSGPFCLS